MLLTMPLLKCFLPEKWTPLSPLPSVRTVVASVSNLLNQSRWASIRTISTTLNPRDREVRAKLGVESPNNVSKECLSYPRVPRRTSRRLPRNKLPKNENKQHQETPRWEEALLSTPKNHARPPLPSSQLYTSDRPTRSRQFLSSHSLHIIFSKHRHMPSSFNTGLHTIDQLLTLTRMKS